MFDFFNASIHVRVYVFLHVFMYVYMYVCTDTVRIHIPTYVGMFVRMTTNQHNHTIHMSESWHTY